MKKKNLKYYLELDYPVIIRQETDEEETWYIAYSKEFSKSACFGLGDTREDALSDFLRNKDEYIRLLYKMNEKIPEPETIDENYSGNFLVRTLPFIHQRLVEKSNENNISLNQYVSHILSSFLAKDDTSQVYKDYFERKLNSIEHMIFRHDKKLTHFIEYNKKRVKNKLEIKEHEKYSPKEKYTKAA